MRIMNRECVLICQLKEKQYRRAVDVIRQYSDCYHWKVEVEQSKREMRMNVDSFPESAARMLMLYGFMSVDRNLLISSSVYVNVGSNLHGIVKLVTEDLYPRIPYHAMSNNLVFEGIDVMKWLDKKG